MRRPLLCTLALLTACAQQQASTLPAASGALGPVAAARAVNALERGSIKGLTSTTPIQHVVIIVQENRSVDNLFNGLPGANTVTSGQTTTGATVQLMPVNLSITYDPSHVHSAWYTEYHQGAMDGFNKEKIDQGTGAPVNFAYAYVPQSQDPQYWTLAETYAFGDNMFASDSGPSYPGHLYLATGNSAIDSTNTIYAEGDPIGTTGEQHPGGCDSTPGTTVTLINPATGGQKYTPVFPCFDHQTIWNLLDAAGVTWRWYQPRLGHGLWFAPDSYSNIRHSADYNNVSAPNTNILSDITAGNLQDVSWVIPTCAESDHSNCTDGSGPAWVAQVVNAIGNSQYWNSTAIIVTWDEWGGWYDHVAPHQYNYFELGFRVPLIVISPYARPAYVSHVQHEFGSTLKFLEENWNLGTLGTTDGRSDDLSDMFNYSQTPLKFATIPGAKTTKAEQMDTRLPDSDDNDGDGD
jgi:phospholipase C